VLRQPPLVLEYRQIGCYRIGGHLSGAASG
jgi:hypothetical protein